MTHGTWICDACERPVNLAHIIPLSLQAGSISSKCYKFAFCAGCNRPDIHRTVLTKAAKEFAAWIQKNHS